MINHKFRSLASWRYRIIKRYKQRAESFYQKSSTEADEKAWLKVVGWLNTILKENRCMTLNGEIGLNEHPQREKTKMKIIERQPGNLILCPSCQSKRVDIRLHDFIPNHKILSDICFCMECGLEFILETPFAINEEIKKEEI